MCVQCGKTSSDEMNEPRGRERKKLGRRGRIERITLSLPSPPSSSYMHAMRGVGTESFSF